MITIEGFAGKGALWCVFRCAETMDIPVQPGYSMVILPKHGITSIPPFECLLPPLATAGAWMDCSTSVYGPRVGHVEVGSLKSVSSPHSAQPNPCEHSTINGSLSVSSTDPLKQLRFRNRLAQAAPIGRSWYSNGVTATFAQGNAGMDGNSYNRLGVLTAYDISSPNADLWYNRTTLLTDWCGPLGPSVPYYTNGARLNQWLTSSPTPSFSAGFHCLRLQCSHVSDGTWILGEIMENHQSTIGVPGAPVSEDSGYGHVICSITRKRSITMTHIKAIDAVLFQGRFTVTETAGWYGNYGTRFNGSTESTYSFEATIQPIMPGLSGGAALLVAGLNAYCIDAQPRAQILFAHKKAKIARSNAISDVSGLDSNWIENLSSVGGTIGVVSPLIQGFKAWKTGDLNEARKALASAFLVYSYVVKPGIKDAADVRDNLGAISRGITVNRFSNERRRGILREETTVLEGLAELTYACTLHLRLKDNPIAGIINALEKLGLDPSAGQLWDLIPLSFVADWFTGIGSKLQRMDAMLSNTVLRDVTSRIESFKVQWPLTSEELLGLGIMEFSVINPLVYSWYDRRVLTGLGSFDPLSGQSFDGLSVSQSAQGLALLSSYVK